MSVSLGQGKRLLVHVVIWECIGVHSIRMKLGYGILIPEEKNLNSSYYIIYKLFIKTITLKCCEYQFSGCA